jgi:hypothetical protein
MQADMRDLAIGIIVLIIGYFALLFADHVVSRPAVPLLTAAREDCLLCANGTETRSEWRAERELEAQSITAASALIGLLISIVGIAYVARTLQQNNELLTIAQKQYQAENRPWVMIKSVVADSDLRFDKQYALYRLKIVVRNSGRSPAVRLRIHVCCSNLARIEPIPDRSQIVEDTISEAKRMARDEIEYSFTVGPDSISEHSHEAGNLIVRRDYVHPVISIGIGYEGVLDKDTSFTTCETMEMFIKPDANNASGNPILIPVGRSPVSRDQIMLRRYEAASSYIT